MAACLGLTLVAAMPNDARGQDWAQKMFTEPGGGSDALRHDFGTVVRGTKPQYTFTIQNLYQEEVHIQSVSTSCGCTSASITKNTLKTHEKAGIVATLNADSFLGSRSATITVRISRPYYAEVQLHVSGTILTSGLIMEPDQLVFGSVAEGQPSEKTVELTYQGDSSWKITALKVTSDAIEAEAAEVSRSGGKVVYSMTVRVKDSAPAGYLKEMVTIVGTDRSQTQRFLEVQAQVEGGIVVRPQQLVLGVLKPGESVTKRVVVRGGTPFAIAGVDCTDTRFKIEEIDAESKALHMIPVTFTAGDTPGEVTETIRIRIGEGEGQVAEFQAQVQVQAAE
jgi:hypothetical protein